MTENSRKTSSKVASQAAKVLADSDAPEAARRLAASALAQSGSDKQTSAELEALASDVLKDPGSSEVAKTLAGSVMSQASHDR